MSIIVTCLSCGQKTKAPDSAAGKTGKCPHCKSPVLVPRAAGDNAANAASASPAPKGNDIGLADDVIEAEVVSAEIVPPVIVPPATPKRRAPIHTEEPEEPIGLADASLSGGGAEPPPEDRRPCPACGEAISTSALQCRFCGEVLDPALKKAAARKKRRAAGVSADDEQMSAGDWVVAIICSVIGCIAGVIWMIQGKPKGKWMLLVSICADAVKSIIWIIIEAANGTLVP